MKNKPKISEANVKKACLHYLRVMGYLFVPIQNQGQWDNVKKIYHKFTGTPGAPDLMVHIGQGKWICVELKSSGGKNPGKQSKAQENFEHMVDREGGRYFIVRSIEDLQAALKE